MAVVTVMHTDEQHFAGEVVVAPGVRKNKTKTKTHPAIIVEIVRLTPRGKRRKLSLVLTLEEAKELRDGITADIKFARQWAVREGLGG